MSEQIDDSYVNGVYVKADGTEQVVKFMLLKLKRVIFLMK